jgi:hypothetical protein
MRLACVIAAALALAPAALGAPPHAGVLVPGQSLGGLRLGATKAQVERAWGRAYGRCTGCAHETWYFNYFAFQPRGAGVEFRDGRAAAIFTLYQPPGWATTRGLALGEPASRVLAEYPALARRDCGDDYYALVQRRGRVVTALYVLDDRLWAFGLHRAGVPLCR